MPKWEASPSRSVSRTRLEEVVPPEVVFSRTGIFVPFLGTIPSWGNFSQLCFFALLSLAASKVSASIRSQRNVPCALAAVSQYEVSAMSCSCINNVVYKKKKKCRGQQEWGWATSTCKTFSFLVKLRVPILKVFNYEKQSRYYLKHQPESIGMQPTYSFASQQYLKPMSNQ